MTKARWLFPALIGALAVTGAAMRAARMQEAQRLGQLRAENVALAACWSPIPGP